MDGEVIDLDDYPSEVADAYERIVYNVGVSPPTVDKTRLLLEILTELYDS